MNDVFRDDEKLYRAVRPEGMYWKERGKQLSSAAFLSEDESAGLSVDRGNYRPDQIVADDMLQRLTGLIAFVRVGDCKETNAMVRYLPVPGNEHHSEIHGGDAKPRLSPGQRKHLSRAAVVLTS